MRAVATLEVSEPPKPAAPSEHAKLSATYVNGLAIAIFAVGGLAPIFASPNAPAPPALPLRAVLLSGLVCVAASVALHLAARRYLRSQAL